MNQVCSCNIAATRSPKRESAAQRQGDGTLSVIINGHGGVAVTLTVGGAGVGMSLPNL